MPRRGVISGDMLIASSNYQRYLFLYDQIYAPLLQHAIDVTHAGRADNRRERVARLIEAGLVIEPDLPFFREKPESDDDPFLETISSEFLDSQSKLEDVPDDFLRDCTDLTQRERLQTLACVYLLHRDGGERTYPVIPHFISDPKPRPNQNMQTVLSIVMSTFPIPAEDVSLDALIDFKQDDDTQHKFRRLWHWIRRVSEGNVDEHDLLQDIEDGLADYEYALRKISRKVRRDRLTFFLTLPLEVIERITSIPVRTETRHLFELHAQRLPRYRGEPQFEGEEFAYVHDALKAFSPANDS